MKVKIDKDMLIKQRFWVLLAVSVPLVLVALLILITSVGAEIESKRKKAADQYNQLVKMKPEVGPNVIEVRTKQADGAKANETVVHRNAFEAQETLFTWPDAVEARFNFQRGRFATEIKIMPAPSKESMPTDTDGELFHGQVVSVDPDAVVVKGKDKELKFQRTHKIKVSKQEKKDNEREEWASIGPGHFLAITYYQSRYFYDPLTENEQTEFANSYKSQIHSILKMIDPVDSKGVGTVQFHNWPYKEGAYPPPKVFTYVAGEWQTSLYFYDEAWMAQEDLWIQRELFRIIRAANDSVAKCEIDKDKDGQPVYLNAQAEDKTKAAVFRNPNFEVTAEWIEGGSKLALTVKNQLPRRQKLDVHFLLKFNKSDNSTVSSEALLIDGQPLDPKGTGKDSIRKEFSLDKGRQRTGIYTVEQVLTWETAAVKRIDNVAIGSPAADIAHGHKTFAQGSQPYIKVEKKEGEKKGEGGGVPGGIAPPMTGSSSGRPSGIGGSNDGGGEVARGPHGVLKDRYLEVSEQSRRVPTGLALIVDQDHIGRVLTAFNNSKLRFLMTQVLLNRYAGSVRPQVVGGALEATGGAKEAADGPAPLTAAPMSAYGGMAAYGSSGPPRGAGSSSGPPKGAGSLPPPGVGATSPMPPSAAGTGPRPGPMGAGAGSTLSGAYASIAAAGASEELENNVEMVIYGVVTLYERYPKRKMEVK